MYTCVYTYFFYLSMCMYVDMHVPTYAIMYVGMYAFMSVGTYVRTYAYFDVHTHIHTYTHACTHTYGIQLNYSFNIFFTSLNNYAT